MKTENSSKKNMYIFTGQEYQREKAIERLLKDIRKNSQFDLEEIHIDGEDNDIRELIIQIESSPLFSEGKLLWVKKTNSISDREKLTKKLKSGGPKKTFIIFEAEQLPASDPLYKLVKEKGLVKNYSQINKRNLPKIVKKMCRRIGLQLTQNGFRTFLELIETDLRRVESELTKLSRYADGNEVSGEEVREIVFTTEEKNIFQLLDEVGNRELRSLNTLKKILSQGEDPNKIFYMLVNHLRSLLAVKSLHKKSMTNTEIAKKTGQFKWLVGKKREQAANFSESELISTLSQLHRQDLTIKTGRESARNCLFELLLTLIQKDRYE